MALSELGVEALNGAVSTYLPISPQGFFYYLTDFSNILLDQTHPDIGLHVAKVIVPGMRHMWKRLAPEQLYEVPVKMGWLSEPLTEERLNSFPMWM